MLNRWVIKVPLLLFLLSLANASYLMLQHPRIYDHFPLLKRFIKVESLSFFPVNLKTSPDNLHQRINLYRSDQNIPTFDRDHPVCVSYSNPNLDSQDQSDIFGICPECSKASIIKISKFATVEMIFAQLIEQSQIHNLLQDPEISLLCIKESPQLLSLFFAKISPPVTPAPLPKPVSLVTVAPAKIMEFTQDELWQALTDYRLAHQVSFLEQDERLCRYARKRVDDHINAFATKEPQDYPIPDKYPLDAHAGFAADADTGYVFEITGMNHIAENLAYWPSAKAATHVIEWGWDSSTEGHREAQLSTDFTKGCISGGQGFFVAIFGRP